jgi:hypothetical protein
MTAFSFAVFILVFYVSLLNSSLLCMLFIWPEIARFQASRISNSSNVRDNNRFATDTRRLTTVQSDAFVDGRDVHTAVQSVACADAKRVFYAGCKPVASTVAGDCSHNEHSSTAATSSNWGYIQLHAGIFQHAEPSFEQHFVHIAGCSGVRTCVCSMR